MGCSALVFPCRSFVGVTMETNIQEVQGPALQAWREFESTLEKVSSQVSGLKIAYTLLAEEKAAAEKGGVQFPRIDTRKIFKKIAALSKKVTALNFAYMYTQTLTAGVQASQQFPGDLDIVIRKDTADTLGKSRVKDATVNLSEKAIQENLEGIPLVVAGVAVVALVVGAIVTVSVLENRAEKYKMQIEKGRQQIEKAALRNPKALAAFTKLRATENHKQGQAWIDKLLGPGTGKALTGGVLGIGLLLVGGFLLFKYMEKK